ncbi:MAG: hypothetical protein GX793_02815 [Bacteroidales bacterium]|jgi:long-subunit fatty acid transport protein|nr:hypothetical protein [Bacteroidales bacterium]MCK9498872.1 hypothetical protein [Bacteroidales bacterium]MDY0315214.1 hypothetical protein [Bacteroidales bacterium]NLB85974.1 hypothetical protein [Bacteroidales bacterium]
MKKIFFITLLISISAYSFSQASTYSAGARAAGMANSGLTNLDAWAVFNNPAAYSFLNQKEIGLYYENRFLLKQTGYGAMTFSTPLFGGSLGLGFSHFGYSQFQDDKFALGYSQHLFKSFSLGVQLNYFSLRQAEDYGNLNALSFEAGILSKPNDKLSIAAYVFNPLNLGYFEDAGLKMPVTLRLGVSYLFSKSLLLSLETGKSINGYTPIFKSGLEYLINEEFAMRAGLSLKPVEYSFGMGYNTIFGNNKIGFDLAFAYHQVLGSSPKISVCYAF